MEHFQINQVNQANENVQTTQGKEYGVISYDKLQGNDLTLSKGSWNKKLNSFDYTFDKAIEIEDDGTVVVYNVQSWKDWSEDDKCNKS